MMRALECCGGFDAEAVEGDTAVAECEERESRSPFKSWIVGCMG
jgi:hypothetical protein